MTITPEEAFHALHLRAIKKGWPGMIWATVRESATLPHLSDAELKEMAVPFLDDYERMVFEEYRAKSGFAAYIKS